MAGGQLVPHTLPDGRTVMVPDYLAKSPALAAPGAPARLGSDMRVAGPGGAPDALGGFANDVPSDEQIANLKEQAQIQSFRDKLMPKSEPAGNSHPSPAKQPAWMPTGEAKKQQGGGGVDPSSLAIPGRSGPKEETDGRTPIDPMVKAVYDETMRGRGGGGPRQSPGMVTATIQEQREPGKRLLPEYEWAHGLSDRPDLGEELDPDAEQPTWGNADPIMRKRQTPIERGSQMAGEAARVEYERQVLEQHAMNAEAKKNLVAQSSLLDEELKTIAERRNRIASMQEAADKRMAEAESMEPRTKGEVWESKGGLAKAFGVISMALGGYMQGLGRSGGKNPGWDMINKLLDDEVEGERYRAEQRKKVGMQARNDVERAQALYGDLDMAALESKNRKLANVMAMTQNMMADRSLDAMAKQRGAEVYAAAQEQYLANKQQLFDQIAGKVVKQDITYKPGAPVGGGGGASTLEALEKAARARKALDAISGQQQSPYQRSIEGDKLNDVNAAMEALDAADAVARDVRALGADNSDFDDPLSGPLDAVAGVIGTGGDGRRKRQSLNANTARLARGIQQSLGKSDNDARLADQMAVGDGSGLSRLKAAETAKRQALSRIQTATAGMTPQQRQAFLDGLPPERRAMVSEALSTVPATRRASSEAPVE